MLSFLKWLFVSLSVGSVLYTGFLMVTAKQSLKQIVDVATLQTGTKVTNPDMTEYDGEQLVWRLKAATAQDKGDVVELEAPLLTMVLSNGEAMPIQAKQGKYYKDKQTVHLQGNVVVGYQGWKLSSALMDYIQKTGELIVPQDFVLMQDGMIVTGTDLHVFRDAGKLQVMQGVHMSIEE